MNKEETLAFQPQLKILLRESYGLDADLQLVVKGVNITFSALTQNSKKFYVRLYRQIGRSEKDIAAECETLLKIRTTRFLSVAKPVADLTGRYFSLIAINKIEKRIVAIFEAALGHSPDNTAADMKIIGRALADLHGQKEIDKIASRHLLLDPPHINKIISNLESFSTGKQAGLIIQQAFIKLSEDTAGLEMPLSFCHGDFRPANMLLKGERVTLFDFDDCGQGPQWLDLATMGFWLEKDKNPSAALLWQALISGYGISNQTAEFQKVVRTLIAMQQLRILRFLMTYCTMSTELWSDTITKAANFIQRSAERKLRIQGKEN